MKWGEIIGRSGLQKLRIFPSCHLLWKVEYLFLLFVVLLVTMALNLQSAS